MKIFLGLIVTYQLVSTYAADSRQLEHHRRIRENRKQEIIEDVLAEKLDKYWFKDENNRKLYGKTQRKVRQQEQAQMEEDVFWERLLQFDSLSMSIPTNTPQPTPPPVPTSNPSSAPSSLPSVSPSNVPSVSPSAAPSSVPSNEPSVSPSAMPSSTPSVSPSARPSSLPSFLPSLMPSVSPSAFPTVEPGQPTNAPTNAPTPAPSPAPTTNQQAETVVRANALFPEQLDDPTSYQSRALDWLINSDPSGLALTDEKILVRYALACIYYATFNVPTQFSIDFFGSDNITWARSGNWISDLDECDWELVECTNDGRVEALLFANNRLTGHFPPEVVFLNETLIILDLFGNPTASSAEKIDPADYPEGVNPFIGQLSNLNILRLDLTAFQSNNGIPTDFGQLTALDVFTAAGTRYRGPLSEAAFPATAPLRVVDISFNTFIDSSIPRTFVDMPNLRFLFLQYSNFTEPDLDFFVGLTDTESPQIQFLWVDGNDIRGTVPEFFLQNLTSLVSLSVTDGLLTGPLPEMDAVAMNELIELYFFNNSFTGGIPESYDDRDLSVLQFQFNLLTTDILPTRTLCNIADKPGLDNLVGDCCICNLDCCEFCFGSNETCPFQDGTYTPRVS